MQYSGLIALTPFIEHSNSQIHFTRSTLYISAAEFPLLFVVHSPRSAVRHTLSVVVTRLYNSCPSSLIERLSHFSNFQQYSRQRWIPL